MHFNRRIYGIENEFGIASQHADGSYSQPTVDSLEHTVYLQQIENSILISHSSDYQFLWHSNGSVTYIDIGYHPEHASPECLSVRDAVRYNKASELLASRVFDYSPTRLLLFKNNLGYDQDSPGLDGASGYYGCHENYLLENCPANNVAAIEELKPLLGMLATRQIFDGAGWWRKNGDFCISQRAGGIYSEIGFSATSDRSFFQLKKGDTGSEMRLHVVCGDANICEFAGYLKIGTMSLILSLFESGCFPEIICMNPLDALKSISQSADPHARLVQINDGSYINALDMQIIFFESVHRQLSGASYADDELEAEIREIMAKWEQSLNAVSSRDYEWMRGRFDYATKQYLAQQEITRKAASSPHNIQDIRKTVDIMYHGISNPALHQRMKSKWHDRRIFTDADIEDAAISAPQNTRARIRGLFVNILKNRRVVYPVINWTQFGFTKGTRFLKADIPSARTTSSPEFDLLLQELESI